MADASRPAKPSSSSLNDGSQRQFPQVDPANRQPPVVIRKSTESILTKVDFHERDLNQRLQKLEIRNECLRSPRIGDVGFTERMLRTANNQRNQVTNSCEFVVTRSVEMNRQMKLANEINFACGLSEHPDIKQAEQVVQLKMDELLEEATMVASVLREMELVLKQKYTVLEVLEANTDELNKLRVEARVKYGLNPDTFSTTSAYTERLYKPSQLNRLQMSRPSNQHPYQWFNNRPSCSQQGPSSSQQGPSSSQRGPSTFQQGHSSSQQGHFSSQQGLSSSQQGQQYVRSPPATFQQGYQHQSSSQSPDVLGPCPLQPTVMEMNYLLSGHIPMDWFRRLEASLGFVPVLLPTFQRTIALSEIPEQYRGYVIRLLEYYGCEVHDKTLVPYAGYIPLLVPLEEVQEVTTRAVDIVLTLPPLSKDQPNEEVDANVADDDFSDDVFSDGETSDEEHEKEADDQKVANGQTSNQ